MSAPLSRTPSAPPLAALLRTLMRRIRLLVILPLAGMVLGALAARLFRTYTADSMFTPQSVDRNSRQYSGLAQQLGLPIQLAGGNDGPDFYRALLYSRDLLVELAGTRFTFTAGEDTLSGTIPELYRTRGRTPEARLMRATGKLRGALKVGTDRTANTVTITIRSRWPALAEQLNRRLLELVNEFNLAKRQSGYAEERRFSESQMKVAEQELDAAEAAQERFLTRNRSYRDDPELSLQMQRLTRRVDVAQQVVQTLTQSFQQARIEEVRNTPLITVVQSPERSAQVTLGLKGGAAIGLALGGLLALGIVIFGEYVSRERASNPEAYDQLTAMLPRRVAVVRKGT